MLSYSANASADAVSKSSSPTTSLSNPIPPPNVPQHNLLTELVSFASKNKLKKAETQSGTPNKSIFTKQSLFDELLRKTQHKKELGVCAPVADEKKRIAAPTPRVVKSLPIRNDEKRLESTVTMHLQIMLASSAASSAVIVREKFNDKIKIYLENLAGLNGSIKTINESILAPLEFLKFFLQLRINRLLLSSYLKTLDCEDSITPRAEQPDKYQAKAINAFLMHVPSTDANDFCRTVRYISELITQKLTESALVKKLSLDYRDHAHRALEFCYHKTFLTLMDRSKYVLPNMTRDGKYLSYLTDNLCKGIIAVEHGARSHFLSIQHGDIKLSEWDIIGKVDLTNFNQQSRKVCTIL